MIRKIAMTLLLAACIWPALAQRPRTRVEWGVIGGINIPDYTTNMSKTDVKNKLGWQAGIVTAVNLGAFAIEPQILYVRQGLRIKPEGAKEINLKSNSIDVPVLVSLRLLRPFRFYAGPVFTVMNDCKQKSGGDLLDFGRVRPTMSYTVGAGVKLLGHMLIDLRYNGQFKGKEDVVLPDGSRLDKLRSYNVALSVGYLFYPMTEAVGKEIAIEGVDPRELYGPRNTYLDQIKALHPQLRIVARGSSLKVLGSEAETQRFGRHMEGLVAYYLKYGHISSEVIAQAFAGGIAGQEAPADKDVIVYGNNGNIIRARTVNQQKLVSLYGRNDLLFAVGPAGSGKTYTAIALAVRALKEKEVRRIILTRPAVEAGEKLGFLPGDMKEKLDPYLQPLYDALNDMIPPAKLAKYLEEGTVQIAPLAYMRGRTLDNAFVILDEAQNTTLSQIKMFLTRMGRNARFIVTGDVTQIDLPKKSDSGLTRSMEILRGVEGIGIVEFDKRDIVRHQLVKYIVDAFDKYAGDTRKEPEQSNSKTE